MDPRRLPPAVVAFVLLVSLAAAPVGATGGSTVQEGANATTDADDDGLADRRERRTYDTDPEREDTDGDGLIDGVEVNEYGTDPTRVDTDGDGLTDGAEVVEGTDPARADTDGDGIADGEELERGSDPNRTPGGRVTGATDSTRADRPSFGRRFESERDELLFMLVLGALWGGAIVAWWQR